MTRHHWAAVAAVLISTSCAIGDRSSGVPCEAGNLDLEAWSAPEFAVTSESPLCDLLITTEVELQGAEDGILPRPPVARAPDGRIVTQTYDPGKIAIWSESGELLSTIGRGAGDGPGEFGVVLGLQVLGDDELMILPGTPQALFYSLSGDFLESVRLPSPGGPTAVQVSEREVLVTVSQTLGRPPVILNRDTVRAVDIPTGVNTFTHLAGDGGAVWVASGNRYLFERYEFEGGPRLTSVRRELPWFPEPVNNRPQPPKWGALRGFSADAQSRIWVQVNEVTGEEVERRGEEYRVRVDELVRWMEVIGPSGELLASEVLDLELSPIQGNIWYRVNDDREGSISIVWLALEEPVG